MDLRSVPGNVPNRVPLCFALLLQPVDAALEFRRRRTRGGDNSRVTRGLNSSKKRCMFRRLALVAIAVVALAPVLRAEGPSRVIISVKEQKLMLMADGARMATYPISTSKFGIGTISAFPLQGYHTEKKLYICVRTWNHFDRHKVLKAVREVGISTASDDLNPTYYYRKVAREERLPLSSWVVLSNYLFERIQGYLSLPSICE